MLRIAELRKQKHTTQKQLADFLNVGEPCISLWERGKRSPNVEQLQKMASFFNVTIDYLTGVSPVNCDLPAELLPYVVELPRNFVPLVGQVVAGVPVESSEYIESFVAVSYNDYKNYFALRIKGESMTNARINDGDIAIIRKQNTAEDGDIVVALVDGEQTIKRFKRYGENIFLMPENPKFSPIPITEETDFIILGKIAEIRIKL